MTISSDSEAEFDYRILVKLFFTRQVQFWSWFSGWDCPQAPLQLWWELG